MMDSPIIVVAFATLRLLTEIGFLVAGAIDLFRRGDRYWIYFGIAIALSKHPLA